jgi:hypothetical protein
MKNTEKLYLVKQAVIIPALVGGSVGAMTADKDESRGEQFARGAGVGVMTDAGSGLGGLLGAGVGGGAGYGIGKLIEKLQGYKPSVDEYGIESSNPMSDALLIAGLLGGGALGLAGGGYGGYRLGRKMLMPYKKDKKNEDKRD